jgi:hypothetical protein
MMSMGDAAACMSVPSYPSQHHHLYRHGYRQLIAHTHPCHPQQKQHFPYLPMCPCGCDTPSSTTTPTAISATTHHNHHQGPHSGIVPYHHHLPCPAIEMLLRASAQSTEARAVEEQRNMVRTKWAAILYTAISTLGILFACAVSSLHPLEKGRERKRDMISCLSTERIISLSKWNETSWMKRRRIGSHLWSCTSWA